MLERLALCGLPGPAAAAGVRQARSRGAGPAFQDYRQYQPGDDPRAIDWTVEARLGQLVVRVAPAEAHLQLHLLIDTSASMGVGIPSKLACATRVAAALCYLAVHRRDSVGVATFDQDVRTVVLPAPGRQQLQRVFAVLGAAVPSGRSRFVDALTQYGSVVRGGGVAVVLSDFFQPDDTLDGLRHLRHRGLTPAVVQIVADEELDPAIDDEVDLADAEDPSMPMHTVDPRAVAGYLEAMGRRSSELATFCETQGLPWARLTSSCPFETSMQACLDAGLLSAHA